MKAKLFSSCLILGISLFSSCATDDKGTNEPQDPYQSLAYGDFALVIYDNPASQDAVQKLKDEQIITAVVPKSENDSQYYQALEAAKDGAIMYFWVDCSAYGSTMPREAYDELKEMWQAWSDAIVDKDVKQIVPLWLVNIVDDQQGEDIFGVSMGPGWYLMSTDSDMPKFYLGETFDDIDFSQYIPQFTPSRDSKLTSKSKSSDQMTVKLQSVREVVKLPYYYDDWDSFKDQYQGEFLAKLYSYKFSPLCLHEGVPDADPQLWKK